MKNFMEVDLRKHPGVRADVHAALKALLVQGRQIWGNSQGDRLDLVDIVPRLMVGVGDLARLLRDRGGILAEAHGAVAAGVNSELKKELGNIVFSTIRWIDDLGLDPMECLELAIEAQEKFVASGRPR